MAAGMDHSIKSPGPYRPPRARLVGGLIFSGDIDLYLLMDQLEETFAPVADMSRQVRFSWTSYYEKEMGPDLYRRFLAFECLVPQDCLPEMKSNAIALEDRWKIHGKRRVNIDPGILTAERLVLATTKNFTHRIYLSRGIFADLTLVFRKGEFRPLDWTYPDYRESWSISFWGRVRDAYLEQLRKSRKKADKEGEKKCSGA